LAAAARLAGCTSTLRRQLSTGCSLCCAGNRAMLDFMENVQNAFYEASHWNIDNSYGALNATARGASLSTLPRTLLTVPCSTARFRHTQRPATADIVSCCAQLCDLVHTRKRRCRRWLRILPVLITPAATPTQELQHRPAYCHQRLQTCARAEEARRQLVVGAVAGGPAHRPQEYVASMHAQPLRLNEIRHAALWAHIPAAVQTRGPVSTSPYAHSPAQDRCSE
jgi:hypothetical protein